MFEGITALHFWHWIGGGGYRAWPHCPQNLFSSGFLLPHLRQIITCLIIFSGGFMVWNMYCAIPSPMARPIPAEKALPTLYLLIFIIMKILNLA
jgi:hypothetical protein